MANSIIFSGVKVVYVPKPKPKNIILTSASFVGSEYQNNIFLGAVAMSDFNIFANNGSGTLLNNPDGYALDFSTGTITMTPGNYIIIF